jgi:hypothetical protein
MNKVLYSVLVLLFSGLSQFVFAFDLGTWNIINLKYKHTKNLSLFGEAQLRSLKMYCLKEHGNVSTRPEYM